MSGPSRKGDVALRVTTDTHAQDKLWVFFLHRAEAHDRELIDTWKEDLNITIIFAGLYSASLTALLSQSYQALQPDPSQDAAALLTQAVALLSQISQQLASNGTQLSFPSALPPFELSSSDLRVNVCWFMSLVFSLSAVLAATILQQWVRDYTQIFHLYYDPLTRARACQFLYEGTKNWRMSTVVDIIPALIHIALFLFFFGLADFLFHINLTVGITTIVTVALCGLFYAFCTFAPLIRHDSPYHTPLSVIFWWPLRSFRAGDKLARNLLDAHVQFGARASPEDYRCDRDARALAWTIASASEESDFEKFLRTIPQSLSNDWGVRVWKAAGRQENHNPAYFVDYELPIEVLRRRINALLLTCIDPGIMKEEERIQRIQTCIDAAVAVIVRLQDDASLWFSEDSAICETLVHFVTEEKHHVMVKWICLMVIALKQVLRDDRITRAAQRARDLIPAATDSEHRSAFDRAAKDMVRLIDDNTSNILSLVPDLRTGPLHFELSVSQDFSWQSWRLEDISNSGIVFSIEILLCALSKRDRISPSSRNFIKDTIRSLGRLENSSVNQEYLQAVIDRVRSPELSSLSFLLSCLEATASSTNSTKELESQYDIIS